VRWLQWHSTFSSVRPEVTHPVLENADASPSHQAHFVCAMKRFKPSVVFGVLPPTRGRNTRAFSDMSETGIKDPSGSYNVAPNKYDRTVTPGTKGTCPCACKWIEAVFSTWKGPVTLCPSVANRAIGNSIEEFLNEVEERTFSGTGTRSCTLTRSSTIRCRIWCSDTDVEIVSSSLLNKEAAYLPMDAEIAASV